MAKFFQRILISNNFFSVLIKIIMFKNYIVSALRNITKRPFYAFLVILGLTIGLAAFIFILIYVSDEISYDKYNVNHSRIHRLESDFAL